MTGVALAIVAVTAAATSARNGSVGAGPPVVALKHAQFGNVLARRDRQALYCWKVEKADFKVQCKGACARA